jgi:uncharacterized membrane protein YkvA (DUF1232 family)
VVLKAAADLMDQVAAAEAPEFVQERISKLALLVQMLEDQRWRLTGADRARVLNVLAYFVDPDDLIPDRIPGLGYLDDAIMVELVLQELRHEIEAYQKFCEFHEVRRTRPRETAAKRSQLQGRMRRNRREIAIAASPAHGGQKAAGRVSGRLDSRVRCRPCQYGSRSSVLRILPDGLRGSAAIRSTEVGHLYFASRSRQ